MHGKSAWNIPRAFSVCRFPAEQAQRFFARKRHRRVYQAGLFFRQALRYALSASRVDIGRTTPGVVPASSVFCHTGHGPLVRGKTLRSSFSFLYYTYYNIFQILLQRHDAAATAEPHALRFCMVERPQSPSRTECAWQRRAWGHPIPARAHTGDRRVWPKAHSCATMSKTTGTEATGYGAFKTADPAGRAGERRRRTQGGQLSQPPNGCDAAE